jgi:outer membrane protein OmpA-like peptidoglycan-associated protein
MRTLKTFVIAALVLGGSSLAHAQATYTDKDGNEYQFKKHLFLDLQGGAQYTLGEAKFGDLLSPNVQLGLGYQFNPYFAARLQANGWQSMGGYNGINELGQIAAINSTYKYKYVAPGLDFIFNLSNIFAGWNPMRVFNVSAFVGGGANIGFDNDDAIAMADANHMRYIWDGTKVRPFGRGGIELNFRVSDAVSIMLEGNANILSDKYNSKKADNPDWYFNALAGLRINLGKTYTKKEKPAPEPEPEPVPVPAPAPVVEPAPEPAPVVKAEPIRRDVFFTINKYVVRKSEQVKVDEVVAYLNEHPEAKVNVTGYADAGTGNNTINDRLAKQRADVVVKALTAKGISADRITSDSKGARVQPFAENNKNRVTILIAE